MDFSNFFDEVKGGLSEVYGKFKAFREKAHALLSGEDEEYNSLSSKYEPILKSKLEEVKNSGDSKKFVESLLSPQNSLSSDKDFINDPNFRKYLELRQAQINSNMIDIGGISSGLASKLSGKFGRVISDIASSNAAEEILQKLKSLKVSDDIASNLSKRLATVNDTNLVHQIVRGAQAVSDVESKIGIRLVPEERSLLSEKVNAIVKGTTDSSAENIAIKKVIDDFSERNKKIIEESKSTTDELKKKLLDLAKSSKTESDFLKRADISGKSPQELSSIYKESQVELPTIKEKKPGVPGESGLKKVGLDSAKTKVSTTEEKILKDKMKLAEKSSSVGYKAGKHLGIKIGKFKEKAVEKTRVEQIHAKYQNKQETLENFRKSVRQYASDLPLNLQRKVLSQVKFSELKTGKQLNDVLGNIDTYRAKVKNEISRRKVREEVRSLRKLVRERGLSSEVNRKIAKLGIRSEAMIKSAPKKTLEKIKEIAKESIDRSSRKQAEKEFKDVKLPGTSKSKTKEALQSVGHGIESALGTVSSNIRKYGGDRLFNTVRRRRYELNKYSKEYSDKISGFEKRILKIKKKWFGGKTDYADMSSSLFNGNWERALEIARKYKMEDDLMKVRPVLDDILKRANEADLKIGELKNYFPRIVKDYDGLFRAYNEKFGKEGRSFFQKLLDDAKAKNFNKDLSQEERADILTKALRGYGEGKINVGSANKARKVRDIPKEFLQYYHAPEDALPMYINKMNDRITLKKLFGLEGNEQDSIGAMVDGMDISPDKLFRLKESLGAALSPRSGENWALNKLRKTATLTLLSHVSSTLFQIADIGLNAYKHGIGRSLISLFRKKPIKRDELFSDITYEFADSNVIKNALKAVGFDRLDRLNVESFMGNAFRKGVRLAKSGSGKKYDELLSDAKIMFDKDNDRIAQFVSDLKNGKVTDDTKYYVFNKVLDVSPRSLEEMPEAYAKNPNARLFYSMKSYAIKVLDVYRNDVAKKWKTQPVKAAKNFVYLTSILTMAGATGSQIRDWYNGKDTKFSDNVVNNMLNIMLLSSYDVSQISTDGLGKAIVSKILPPTRIFDDIGRDIASAGDGKGLTSIRNIPVIGNEIYNRIGKGKEAIDKSNLQRKFNVDDMSFPLTSQQKSDLAKLRREKPSLYAKTMKELKWKQLGLTDKEKSFASMGVEDHERAEAIVRYLKNDSNWQSKYAKLRRAGIVTDEVHKQVMVLRNK